MAEIQNTTFVGGLSCMFFLLIDSDCFLRMKRGILYWFNQGCILFSGTAECRRFKGRRGHLGHIYLQVSTLLKMWFAQMRSEMALNAKVIFVNTTKPYSLPSSIIVAVL